MCVSKVFGQTSRLITSFIVALILFTTSQTEAQILKFKHRNAAFQAGLEYVREMWFSPDNKFAYSASSGGLGVFDYDPITGS
ncbi:MAG TPA: hypothetical protein PKU83_11475, partial [Chryseolinea sp.]|nr:hypothetical protein [Chryseolinea sp.]